MPGIEGDFKLNLPYTRDVGGCNVLDSAVVYS